MKFKISILLWLRNCWRIIKYSAKRYTGDQLGQQAVVLTYYTLFAIVPMVALLFGISKGFGLEAMLREAVYSRFPAQHGMLDYVCEIAEKTLSEASGGVVAGVGVVVLLWTVIWLNANVERSFNVVWGLASRRNMLRKFSSYISLILLAPVLMVIVNTLGTLLTSLKDTNGIAGSFSWLKPVVEYSITLLPIAVTCLFFFFLYLKVPNTKVRWQGACVAGIITGVAFQVLQDSFVFLQSSVFAYNRLYGGFAILPLFLIWVNWSWQLILFGAEISFVHQHLRSGVFNEIRGNVDLRLRREHQLAILHRVFLEFEKGNGPVFEDELALLLRVPDVVFRSEVNELLDKGMLCRSVSTEDRRVALLPGVPPDRFTIMDFMIEIHGQGDKEVQEFARFEELFVKIENAVKESGLNMKVHEV